MISKNPITYILLLLIASYTTVLAQENILTASAYKKGTYKNYEEFKNNNPSIPFEFQVARKTGIFW